MERRFHNPYKYWKSGFVFEVVLYSVFAGLMLLTAVLAAWIFG